ncbi:MAG: hypothetical protein MUF48_21140 [Pirellulaceae bacterium]|jgi:hypothetical protein|nr:hypothetical protein [Pirellulaceae bacterium]
MPLFETARDLREHADMLRRRAYGVIVMQAGRLQAVHLRPCPKLLASRDLVGPGRQLGPHASQDTCWLYYNQPCRHPRFLALKYIVSSPHATFSTFRGALVVLDEIARLKHTDAIVAEVRNLRISDRLLHRWGWERHLPASRRRHYIKRFYGVYPAPHQAWELMAGAKQTG